MRKWFWLAVISDGRLRWPRWYKTVLAIFFVGVLLAGLIYAFIVFRAVSERGNPPHVHAPKTR